MMNFFRRQKRLTPLQLKAAVLQLEALEKQKRLKYQLTDQAKLNKWFEDYTGLMNLCTLTREDAREHILESLADDTIRTHLLELSIAFYSYGGDTDDFEERLVNSLADGLRFEGRDPSLCELPQEILASGPLANFPWTLRSFALNFLRALRVTTEVSLHEYLLSNRHMQIVMLASLADDLVNSNTPEKTS